MAVYKNGYQIGVLKGDLFRPYDRTTDSFGPPPPAGMLASARALAAREAVAVGGACDCGPGGPCKGRCGTNCNCANRAVVQQVQAEPPGIPTGGVDLTKIDGGASRYYVNGFETTQAVCEAAVGAGGTLADDSGRWFVVYVSSDKAKRDSFCERWAKAAELAGERDKCHCVAHDPSSPMAKQRGYTTPGFYIVDKDGNQLTPALPDAPDSNGLADLLRRLRNPDVPLIQPRIEPKITLNIPTWAYWVGGGLLAIWVIQNKKKEDKKKEGQ